MNVLIYGSFHCNLRWRVLGCGKGVGYMSNHYSQLSCVAFLISDFRHEILALFRKNAGKKSWVIFHPQAQQGHPRSNLCQPKKFQAKEIFKKKESLVKVFSPSGKLNLGFSGRTCRLTSAPSLCHQSYIYTFSWIRFKIFWDIPRTLWVSPLPLKIWPPPP